MIVISVIVLSRQPNTLLCVLMCVLFNFGSSYRRRLRQKRDMFIPADVLCPSQVRNLYSCVFVFFIFVNFDVSKFILTSILAELVYYLRTSWSTLAGAEFVCNVVDLLVASSFFLLFGRVVFLPHSPFPFPFL